MGYLNSAGLIIVAAALVAIGAASSNAVPYVFAAAISAVAIAVIWRRAQANREVVFLTDAPEQSKASHWDRPISRANAKPTPEGFVAPVVAIEHYENLLASEVLPSLETLSVDELQAIIVRERHGMARGAIIHRAEVLIDLTLGRGSAQRMAGSGSVALEPERTQERTIVEQAPMVMDERELVEPEVIECTGQEREEPAIEMIRPEPHSELDRDKAKELRKDDPELGL